MATKTAKIPALVIGDDWAIPVTLSVGDPAATFAIDSGATIKARLISKNHCDVLTDVVTVLEAATGSDWANSKVVVEITGTLNGVIDIQGAAKLELQVDDPAGIGIKTFFGAVNLLRGTID